MPTPSRTDFATLKRPHTPNTYLLAPEGFCREAKADGAAPVFDAPAAKLRTEFLSVVIAEPRVSHTLADEGGLYDDFVVRSAVLGFPDLVSVKFLDAGRGQSTLALYARAVYGRWDMGVNRTRTQAWLKRLGVLVKSVKP
jgi:uncharacterized protein (DUF1499 family)